eukprot:7923471-Pyramimonas_sp.AAC.1
MMCGMGSTWPASVLQLEHPHPHDVDLLIDPTVPQRNPAVGVDLAPPSVRLSGPRFPLYWPRNVYIYLCTATLWAADLMGPYGLL